MLIPKYKALPIKEILFLSKRIIDKLYELNIDYIQVSIESYEERTHDALRGKGNFKKCLKAIEYPKDAGFTKEQLYITVTITKLNENALTRFSEFAKKLGVKSSFSFFQPVGRAFKNEKCALGRKKLLRFFYESIKKGVMVELNESCLSVPNLRVTNEIVPSIKNHCGMVIKTLGVKENGDIVPCHLFFSSKEFVLGNILNEGIIKKLVHFLNTLPTIDEIEECNKCDIRYFCGNGCWASVYWRHGHFKGRNPYCRALYD